MFIFHQFAHLNQHLDKVRSEGKNIGYVPTMGALHQGHISLVNQAKKSNAVTVCTVFVNPTQFNNPDDLKKYPRNTEQDIALLIEADCDILYLPEVADVYPDGTELNIKYDLGYLETVLEGAYRPGHFQGVAQVVDRFLDIIRPDNLYMGRKDYQQCLVIQRLLELKHPGISLHLGDTRREQDGLAMSSRNKRLTEPQRALSSLIYQCLISIQTKKGNTPFSVVKKECEDLLEHKGFRPDYVALADAGTLQLLEDYDTERPMLALIAAYIGNIRLIDNIEL